MQRHYSNFIDSYLEYTEPHEATTRVSKWSCISILAAALERRVWMNRGFYTLYPNLYVFIIGRSGLIKKSTSTGIAVNLFRELEGVKIMSERLTASSLIDQFKMAGKKIEINNRKYNQSALFAYASELSVFMSEVFGSITELLTTFYDCIPNDSSKPWVYNTLGRGEIKIYGPCLNILGASTKAWLKKCIPKSEMEGGFTSRIIFVVENNLPDKLVAWPSVDLEGELRRVRLIEDLRQIHALAGEVKVTPEAKELFTRWYETHMRDVVPYNQDPRMVGYMARKGDTILKLAMVHSAATSNDLVIGVENIIWASREIDSLEMDWRLAFDGLGVNTDKLAFDLRDFIRKKVRVKKVDLLNTFGSQYPPTEVSKALNELLEMDEISSVDHEELGQVTGYYTFKGADLNIA
jgi:hypothetical protein